MKNNDFRVVAQTYQYWKERLKKIKNLIDAVETEMEGYKSPSNVSGVRGSSSPQAKSDKFFKLSEKLEKLESQRDLCEKNIHYIHNKIYAIKDKAVRQMVKDVLINGITVRELAIKYSYSKSVISRKINKACKKIGI